MGLAIGIGNGILFTSQRGVSSIVPELLADLCARATYCENNTCTTNTLEEIEAIRYTAPVLPVGLLADYPGAAAAYSLRNLIDTTTSVVRVRRSNDNTEQDFTATEVTDGTLTAFTGANDGFVTIWYDQSGNSNNAAQATAVNQPQIVESGSLIIENNKAGIKGLYTNSSNLKSGAFNQGTINQPVSSFIAGSPSFSNDSVFDTDISGNFFVAGTLMNAGTTLPLNVPSVGNQYLISVLFNTTNSKYYINTNLENSGDAGTGDMEGVTLFNRRNPTVNNGQQGILQEIILYPIDQSTNQTDIESNINNHYSIY